MEIHILVKLSSYIQPNCKYKITTQSTLVNFLICLHELLCRTGERQPHESCQNEANIRNRLGATATVPCLFTGDVPASLLQCVDLFRIGACLFNIQCLFSTLQVAVMFAWMITPGLPPLILRMPFLVATFSV
jgi:hypothetical protein